MKTKILKHGFATASGFTLRASLVVSIGLLAFAGYARQAGEKADSGKMWAFVVGISNYTRAEPLKFAASDAESFSDFLKSPRGGSIPEERVLTLLEDQASRQGIIQAIDRIQEKVQPGDAIYIYIAGHGYTKKNVGYFIPSDGDIAEASSTGVPFTQLKDMIESGLENPKYRILITDICNAGRLGPESSERASKIQNILNDDLLRLKAPAGTFLNMLASRPNESSWENEDIGRGVFTHILLEALNGKAATPGELIVNARSVVDYVRTEVPKYTANTQHPMANESFDPKLTLSFLDRPGPKPKEGIETTLVIVNLDRKKYARMEWIDPKTRFKTVRALPKEANSIRIGSLSPGEMDLHFYDSEKKESTVKVKLARGVNTVDISSTGMMRRFPGAPPVYQVASAAPVPPPSSPPQGISSAGEAQVLLQLQGGTEVYVDGTFLGSSDSAERFLQLQGIAPGMHNLTLVPSTDREYRFRVKLFSGQHLFDLPSGEMRFILNAQVPPSDLLPPGSLPTDAQDLYRRFFQAIWDQRLVEPSGNCAWDYFSQLRDRLPVAIRDSLRDRLVLEMGNRAQRIILKYIRGGDTRWNAATFEEGTRLVERVRQLFKSTPGYEAQQSFFTGRALIERGNYPQAIQELQRAVALDAQASHAFNAIGLALWKQNLLDQAIQPLQQAIAISPQWTFPRNTLALVYLEQRRYPEAEQEFQGAIAIQPEDSTAYHGLAQLNLYFLNRETEAEQNLQRAIEFRPGNAYAYDTRGKLYVRQDRLAEAEAQFRIALRLEPDEPSFQASLADVLRRQGRGQDAQQIFARIANQHPDNIAVVEAYTDFLAEQKRAGEASSVFQNAVRLSPKDANLRVLYGRFLQEQKNERESERQYKAALQLVPNNAFAHHNLGSLYLIQKKVSEAEAELRLSMKADPRLAAPHTLLGRIRLEQKKYSEAVESFRQALSLPSDAQKKEELNEFLAAAETAMVGDQLGEARKRSAGGKHSEAWKILVAAFKGFPTSHDLRNEMLQIQAEHPTEADISGLPPGVFSDVLNSPFWKGQLRAEELWRQGQKTQAAQSFREILERMAPREARVVSATPFNIRNEQNGIHAIVIRWGLRSIEQKEYNAALTLMETAVRQKIFGAIPDYSPLTIDSLMTRPEVPNPSDIKDFDIAHHPERRAHEVYAAALAGKGEISEARKYLLAIESGKPDLSARLRMARALRQEKKWAEGISLLKEAVTNPEALAGDVLLADIYLDLSEIQCDSGDCASARDTLLTARQILPKEKRFDPALRKLKP